jgi:hypothetical protein
VHRRRAGHETKYQTYREKRRNEDYLIRAEAGGQEVHNGYFIIEKGSKPCGFRRHRRAYSVRVARGAPGNEVRENEEMTGTRTKARARRRGDEGEKKRERARESRSTRRRGSETKATRRRGSPREGGRALRQAWAPTLTSILTWP